MERPNILMIMTDQQRRDTLGAYGCDWIRTPNLDRLAAEGTLFTRCTVNSPICTPSRASIFTGKTVPEHSVLRVHDNLPDDEILFTERLRHEAGYRTALFGKLHTSGRITEEKCRHPGDGFDIYEWCLDPAIGLDSRFNGYAAWLRSNAPDFLAELQKNGRRVPHHPENVHMSKWAADRTIAFLNASKSERRPFFCLMSLFDPHDPYQDHPISARCFVDEARIPAPIVKADPPASVRREQLESYAGRADAFSEKEIRDIRCGYAASLGFADQQIGRVLDALQATGLDRNTLVLFISDHGDQLGDHGLLVKGVGLYEPSIGVPLIMRWPDHVAAGARCDSLAQGHDIAATCLSAAGLESSACPASEDLVAMARAWHARRQAAICAYRNSGINNAGRFWEPPMISTSVRNARHKLIAFSSGGITEYELFDLAADPQETQNLAGAEETAVIERNLLGELTGFLQAEVALIRPRAKAPLPGAHHRIQTALNRP